MLSAQNRTFLSQQPPWVGKMGSDIAIGKECKYCKSRSSQTLRDIIEDSGQSQCLYNRTGVMWGSCTEGYSLQLGGEECADCYSRLGRLRGVAFLTLFAAIGIILVLLLFCLNITVSTGIIDGLVFYCNIVYLNSETLLPISRDGKQTHRQNAVRLLSTIQAWVNLDFGIISCFFDGYNTYISTWVQLDQCFLTGCS